jgi:DNA-binding CsgD family transcriptional regulator
MSHPAGMPPVQSSVITRIVYGYTLNEIGRHLGIHYTTVSKIIKASKKN